MFTILKYIQPTWYFNLKPGVDFGYFPNVEEANEIEIDKQFSSEARKYEIAYRANRIGLNITKKTTSIDWWSKSNISKTDEYRFARKYFHSSRIFIALALRLLSFHNPFTEIAGFVKSRNTKRLYLRNNNSEPEGFHTLPFTYKKINPLVSVIIPTLNRYNFLDDVLSDFEKQDYKNLEFIIVDQSDKFDTNFYNKFNLSISVIRQEEKALWLARNTAIKKSSGEYIAFSEDDVRVPSNWISNHLKCLEYFSADISNGIFFPKGSSIPEERNYFRLSDQFATGNSFLKKSVFAKTGLFDRQFEKQRMGDGEFGLRCYKIGVKSVTNPLAWCEDVKASTGGLREAGQWDAYRPKSLLSPRPIPSVLYLFRKYFGIKPTLISLAINIPPSIVPYQFKRNKKLLLVGSLLSFFLLPVIIFQVLRSWRKSTTMLNNSLIENYNG